MKATVETYGCPSNKARGEIIKGLLERRGCEIVKNQDLADILILNTCAAKDSTKKRLINRLDDWTKNYSERDVMVAGCMPQATYGKAKDIAPQASLVGPNNCKDVPRAVKKIKEGNPVEYLDDKKEKRSCLPRIRKNKLIEICEITRGCFWKPKHKTRSYEMSSILEEIKRSTRSGCKEVWLASRDAAFYGNDIGKSLPELLNNVVKIPGRFRVKVGMMKVDSIQPILDELLNAYNTKEIYSFLHLPLWSGSNKVLRKMDMGYTAEDFKETVKTFKKRIPELNLKTDIIIGLPGENKEDFELTMDILEEIKLDRVDVKIFRGTENTVDEETKKERYERLSKIAKNIRMERLESFVGQEKEVLVIEKNNKGWVGRDKTYRNIFLGEGEKSIGDLLNVRTTSRRFSGLIGSKIKYRD